MYSQIYPLILVLTYGPWLVSQPGQKHIKPGLAGHEKPKPDEAKMLALALNFSGQKPEKARPETWLSGQAGPVNH